jgi:hypothetical protein
LLQNLLQGMAGVTKVKLVENTLQLSCDGLTTTQVNEFCISKGIVLSHLLLKKKSLETKFMELTN